MRDDLRPEQRGVREAGRQAQVGGRSLKAEYFNSNVK